MHPLKGKAKASPRLNATNVYASTPYPLDGFDLGGRSPLPLAANVPIKPRATQCISLIIGDRRIRLKGRRVFRYVVKSSFVEMYHVHGEEEEEFEQLLLSKYTSRSACSCLIN